MIPLARVWTREEMLKRVANFVIGGDAPQNEFTPASMRRIEAFERTGR